MIRVFTLHSGHPSLILSHSLRTCFQRPIVLSSMRSLYFLELGEIYLLSKFNIRLMCTSRYFPRLSANTLIRQQVIILAEQRSVTCEDNKNKNI